MDNKRIVVALDAPGPSQALALAARLAAALCRVKVGKELFYRLMDMEFEKAVRTASAMVTLMASFPQSIEGFTAFVEKRPPDWKDG